MKMADLTKSINIYLSTNPTARSIEVQIPAMPSWLLEGKEHPLSINLDELVAVIKTECHTDDGDFFGEIPLGKRPTCIDMQIRSLIKSERHADRFAAWVCREWHTGVPQEALFKAIECRIHTTIVNQSQTIIRRDTEIKDLTNDVVELERDIDKQSRLHKEQIEDLEGAREAAESIEDPPRTYVDWLYPSLEEVARYVIKMSDAVSDTDGWRSTYARDKLLGNAGLHDLVRADLYAMDSIKKKKAKAIEKANWLLKTTAVAEKKAKEKAKSN